MRPASPLLAVHRLSFREAAGAGIAIAAWIVVVMFLFAAQSRVTRPLWLDECITALIANDESFAHMLRAIRGGAENNPPTFYVIVWPIARAFGGLDAMGLRVFAGLAMVVALTGVYAVARVYCDRLQAAVGTAILAAHPIVVGQTFEARFYGAWLAATAWFAFAMVLRPSGSGHQRLLAWRCILAFLVATLHWFGIVVVALIVVGAMVRERYDTPVSGETWHQHLAPALSAVVGVALFSPFLLSQRSGLTVPTWIEPTTVDTIVALLYRLFYNPVVLTVGVLAAIWIMQRLRAGGSAVVRLAGFAPVWMVGLFPVIITALSVLMQPLLYERYLLPSLLPLGVFAACLTPRVNRRWGWLVAAAAVVGLGAALGREMRRYNRAVEIADWRIRNALSAVDRIIAAHGPLPVVFVRRFEQYPVIQLRPSLASSIALIDFDGAPNSLMPRTIFERDMARRMTRFYPDHRLVRVDSLRGREEFFAITSANEEDELRRLLPGFVIQRRAPDVYHVSR